VDEFRERKAQRLMEEKKSIREEKGMMQLEDDKERFGLIVVEGDEEEKDKEMQISDTVAMTEGSVVEGSEKVADDAEEAKNEGVEDGGGPSTLETSLAEEESS
jgi:hypothetical protein